MDAAGGGLARRRGGWALPAGSGATLAGIVVSGLCGFGSLVLATRTVDSVHVAALAATWTLVFLVGPAVFFPLEQALAGRLLGDAAPGAGQIARLAALVVGGLSVLAVALVPLYLDDLLDGRVGLLAAVVVSFVGHAAQHVLRAMLVARRSFRRYAFVLSLDGLLRLVGCALAALSGVRAPELYAWVIGAAPLVTTLACAAGVSHPQRGRATYRGGPRLGTDLARLVIASLGGNVVIGAGPAVLKLLVAGSSDEHVVATYLVTASLTRIPLLVGQAILAPLLAGLAVALAAGQLDAYQRTLGGAVRGVVGIGMLTTVGFALTAPTLVPAVFGAEHNQFGAGPAAVLAAAAVAFLTAQFLTQALVAQRRTAYVAVGWLLAVAVFALGIAVWPGDLARVLAATLIGCVAATALLAPAATRPSRSLVEH